MSKTLTVLWNRSTVGEFALNLHGDPEFRYAPEWLAREDAQAVSVSLPLQSEPFSRRATLPFFEGLLPEEPQRTAIAQSFGFSEQNAFRLLEELGGEVAGALELWPEGTVPPVPTATGSNMPLSDVALQEVIDQLPVRPMRAGGKEGLRLSLAGAQNKLPVVLFEGRIALPAAGQPTTHILKPGIPRFEGTAENEAICMTLAADIGLQVAPVQYHAIGDTRFILVERYDRIRGDDGQVRRLHQEDFCQALGLTSANKYASDGGPIFADCFNLIRREATRPATETLKLLDAVIFNTVIGNADAHGKNFSLLYRHGGTEFSPLYDLLSTIVYPGLSPHFAMRIAKRRTLEEIRLEDWVKFAREIEMGAPFVRRRVQEIASAIAETVASSLERLELPEEYRSMASDFSKTIKTRAIRVLSSFP